MDPYLPPNDPHSSAEPPEELVYELLRRRVSRFYWGLGLILLALSLLSLTRPDWSDSLDISYLFFIFIWIGRNLRKGTVDSRTWALSCSTLLPIFFLYSCFVPHDLVRLAGFTLERSNPTHAALVITTALILASPLTLILGKNGRAAFSNDEKL